MKPVRIVENTITGQKYFDYSRTSTFLTKYSEDDYISLAKLYWFFYNVETHASNMKIDLNQYNAIDLFSSKAKDYLTGRGNIINLDDFRGRPNTLSNDNYEEFINNLSIKNLNIVKKYRQTLGYLPKNILSMLGITFTKIDLREVVNVLSKEFDSTTPNLEHKSKINYIMWRNQYIRDTVRNFKRKKINKDFLIFIILFIFVMFESEFSIYEFTD